MITRSPNDQDKRTWKLFPTDRALSISEEIRTVCQDTETVLLQGLSEAKKNIIIDLLMRAGKNITTELHIERKEEDFND